MYPDEGSLVSGNKGIDPLLKYANFSVVSWTFLRNINKTDKAFSLQGCAKDFMSERESQEIAQKQFNTIDTLKLDWKEYLND